MRVVDPSGVPTDSAGFTPPARPGTLTGRRLAALDNGKPNAPYVLRSIARALEARFGTEVPVLAGKAVSSRPAPADMVSGFRGFDIAIVGVGD